MGEVDEVFCRRASGTIEHLFFAAVDSSPKRYAIEDGLADHLPSSWKISHLNSYEIHRWARRRIVELFKFYASMILTGDPRTSSMIHSPRKIRWERYFSVTHVNSDLQIASRFKVNILKCSQGYQRDRRQKVIIFGSLLSRNAGDLSIDDEIDFYNLCLPGIQRRHRITENEIWYKPHPRLPRDAWERKVSELACQVCDLKSQVLAEVMLQNPNLLAVYSVGSTALIYATAVFQKPAFQLNLGHKPGAHPSVYEKYRYINKKFNIPLVDFSATKII